jgi:hypothetical protein
VNRDGGRVDGDLRRLCAVGLGHGHEPERIRSDDRQGVPVILASRGWSELELGADGGVVRRRDRQTRGALGDSERLGNLVGYADQGSAHGMLAPDLQLDRDQIAGGDGRRGEALEAQAANRQPGLDATDGQGDDHGGAHVKQRAGVEQNGDDRQKGRGGGQSERRDSSHGYLAGFGAVTVPRIRVITWSASTPLALDSGSRRIRWPSTALATALTSSGRT